MVIYQLALNLLTPKCFRSMACHGQVLIVPLPEKKSSSAATCCLSRLKPGLPPAAAALIGRFSHSQGDKVLKPNPICQNDWAKLCHSNIYTNLGSLVPLPRKLPALPGL